jgi:multicomponent Na+:H+ antiporter subunit D
LAHGLAKSALFLTAGNLPSRSLKELQNKPINTATWIVLVVASLSISGFPLLTGFSAKVLTMKTLLPWQEIAMNVAVVGTVIVYAKFIFLPHGEAEKAKPGFWAAIVFLLGWLITANVLYLEAYTINSILKALVTLAVGWLLYFLIFKRTALKLPRVLEEFEHLIGVMSLIAVLLFWMAFSWLGISY